MNSKLKSKMMLGLLTLGIVVNIVSGALAGATVQPERDGNMGADVSGNAAIELADIDGMRVVPESIIASPIEYNPSDGDEFMGEAESSFANAHGEVEIGDLLSRAADAGASEEVMRLLTRMETIGDPAVRTNVLCDALDSVLAGWCPSSDRSIIHILLSHIGNEGLGRAYEVFLSAIDDYTNKLNYDVPTVAAINRVFWSRGYAGVLRYCDLEKRLGSMRCA